EQVDVELDTGVLCRLTGAAALVEEQDAEAVEAAVTQGEPVLGLVHAKPTGTAGAGREVDVVLQDPLGRPALTIAQVLQIVDQAADREVRGIALTVVAVFLAGLEVGLRRGRQAIDLVAEPAEAGEEQVLVPQRQAAEQNGRVFALRPREWPL